MFLVFFYAFLVVPTMGHFLHWDSIFRIIKKFFFKKIKEILANYDSFTIPHTPCATQ